MLAHVFEMLEKTYINVIALLQGRSDSWGEQRKSSDEKCFNEHDEDCGRLVVLFLFFFEMLIQAPE
jgi:hypothetical protein